MAVLSGFRRGVGAAVLVAGLAFGPAAASRTTQAQPASEHAVKAAFLYNFTRYVAWPSGVPKDSEPFRLCVVADAQTRAEIERAMTGESVHGRPSETIVPRTVEEARRCQVLFVGDRMGSWGRQLVSAVRTQPVLTVGEGNDFIERGGAIQMVLVEARVRFDVNLDNAHRAGLSVNPRLLRVARQVVGERERGR